MSSGRAANTKWTTWCHSRLAAATTSPISSPNRSEPRPGFHEKDQVENYLHDQVCAGALSLLDAQRAIATNWVDVYQRLPSRGFATVVPAAPQPATEVLWR